MDDQGTHLPPELADLAEELRAERPRATAGDLDRIKLAVVARADRRGRQKGTFMKSRLAITSMLVLGFAFSGAGAGLAVSGISSGDDAGVAQYGTTTTTTTTTTPPQQQLAPQGQVAPETLGEVDSGTPPPSEDVPEGAAEVQPTEQVAADDGDSLPFTGLAAIPLLVVGVGLLISGVVLRRGGRSDDIS
jgi:hypothetical protein